MDYTKKIIRQSNYWYNDGLRKAQIRDMSGAVLSLRRSLQYHRGNIAARNLLGLVYFGRGEVSEALVEWILSKNLQPRDNIANKYIEMVQEAADELEVMNEAVKKYNQCLIYCTQDGEDMAIIQLKKVIAAHPNFLKAHQLLALLYMKAGKYPEAQQALRHARRLDTTNEITLRYMQELSQRSGRQNGKKSKRKRNKADRVEYRVGNDTVIQPIHNFVQEAAKQIRIVNFVAGLLIGAVVIGFLVMPAIESSQIERKNEQIREHSQRINSLEAQVSAQTRLLDNYRAADADSAEAAQNAASTADSYEHLLNAAEQYASGSYSEDVIADSLLNVRRDCLGTGGQMQYDSLVSEVFPVACEIRYGSGTESLNVANYATAVDHLLRVVMMNESYDDGGALLKLAQACLGNGDSASATNYFRRVMELFPGTDNAAQASAGLDAIAQSGQNQN